MNNISHQDPEFFESETTNSGNKLWNYVQSMNPETVTQLSQPASAEVLQAFERTIVNLLGNLPSTDFNITIATSRESLGKMLASAILNGYFLRNVEQRMEFEKSLHAGDHDLD